MQFKRRKQRNELPELEITPMLNVMLVVLAFFVAVAAHLEEEGQELRVRLPQQTEALPGEDLNNVPNPESLQVNLLAGGKLAVNDRPMEEAQLLAQLPRYLKDVPQGHVYLRVSGNVPYQTVINTLSSLQAIGGDRVSLVIGSSGQN